MKQWRVPIAGGLAALLLLAAYVVVFHQPRSGRIGELIADKERLRAEQAPLRRTVEALEQVAAREPEFKAAIEHLDRLIPPTLAQPELLAQVQAAAQGAGVDLLSVAFGEPNSPKDAPPTNLPGTVLVVMPVTVIMEGPFAGITDMLRRIQVTKGRAILVGTVAVTEAEDGFPDLTGTWSGQAYSLLPAADPLLVDPNAPRAQPTTTTTMGGGRNS